MPYFAGRLKEQNGEQEYSYDHIIEAETLEDAEKIYEEYAKTFYGDGSDDEPEEGDGGYYFFNGEIWAGVESIIPTTKEAWMENQFNINLLKEGKLNE
jgi:hypothetical protein